MVSTVLSAPMWYEGRWVGDNVMSALVTQHAGLADICTAKYS